MWLYYIAKPIIWFFSLFMFPVKIFNKKKLPDGRCILAINHLSGWDPIIVLTHLNKLVHFMAKSTLYDIKIVKWIFNKLQFIPANRDGIDYKAIKTTIQLLEDGKPFGLFPEGTRNYDDPDHIQEFKNGLALFAIKTRSIVFPVILKFKTKIFRKNYIYFGEPIDLSEHYEERITTELTDKVTIELHDRIVTIQNEFNDMLSKKYPKKFGAKNK